VKDERSVYYFDKTDFLHTAELGKIRPEIKELREMWNCNTTKVLEFSPGESRD